MEKEQRFAVRDLILGHIKSHNRNQKRDIYFSDSYLFYMKGDKVMAFFDWNDNGEKDFADDYIEHQIYKKCIEEEHDNYTPSYGNGISTLGVIVATIGGLFSASAIVTLFGCEEDAPVLIMIILWFVCSFGLGAWFEKIGF